MQSRFQLFIRTVLIVLTLTSCGRKSTDPIETVAQPDPKGILYMRLGAEPTILNPILYTDTSSGSIIGLVFNGLLRVNSDLDFEPELAASYNISDGGKRITFYLKKNVFWHDGHPFTAEDVKFTFDTILNPQTNTVRRSDYIIDGKPIQFKISDPHTVEVHLPKPFAPILEALSMGIIPKHLLEHEDINTAPFNHRPIGTGPFKFKTLMTGQYAQVIRNDTYFGDKPKLNEILLKNIPDQNTATIAFEKGEIDDTGLLPKDYERMRHSGKWNVFHYSNLGYTYMGFNLKDPLFSNPTVRAAFSHALNRDAMVANILRGHGQPLHLPSSPSLWAHPPTENRLSFSYDPAKSKALLESAGYRWNPQSGLMEKNGTPLRFTLLTNKGNKIREQAAQIIQQQLKAVGVGVDIQLLEWKSFIKILNDPSGPKKFQAAMLGWSLGIDPDAYSIWHSSQYPKGFNFIGYKNPKVDRLLNEGREELDREKRKIIYHELFNEIGKDVPYLFLFNEDSLVGINKRVFGLSKPGPAGLFNKIENVFVTLTP